MIFFHLFFLWFQIKAWYGAIEAQIEHEQESSFTNYADLLTQYSDRCAMLLSEIDRALNDHELIKIKVVMGDRALRDALIAQLCPSARATLVQRIGNTATLLRRSSQPDPRKSNLQKLR